MNAVGRVEIQCVSKGAPIYGDVERSEVEPKAESVAAMSDSEVER